MHLSEDDYHRALKLLFGKDDLGRKYLALRHELLGFLRHHSGADLDHEKLADEVFDRVFAKAVDGVEIENLSAFAKSVARFVLKEEKKKQSRRVYVALSDYSDEVDESSIEIAIPAGQQHQIEFLEEEELRSRVLRTCINDLRPNDWKLLTRYFGLETHSGKVRVRIREQLAAELGLSQSALRVRMHRLRASLKAKYLSKLEKAKRMR